MNGLRMTGDGVGALKAMSCQLYRSMGRWCQGWRRPMGMDQLLWCQAEWVSTQGGDIIAEAEKLESMLKLGHFERMLKDTAVSA